MASKPDTWLVRLPDGRVFRSRNITALRHHVRKGRIPRGSRVRRPSAKGWQALEEVRELAEALPAAFPNGVSVPKPAAKPRRAADFSGWRSVGVRGLMRELFDALDSSLQREKLGLACLLGILGCLAWIGWGLFDAVLADWWWWAAAITVLALIVLFAGGLVMTLITQTTFIQLSRLRQPRANDLWPSSLSLAARLAFALLVVVGGGIALILTLRWLPTWMSPADAHADPWWHYGAAAVLIARLVLEVLFWPMLALAPLLLGPILVVEECSAARALVEWWSMLRKHLGRIFLYEALAGALGVVFTTPLVAPILLATGTLEGLHASQIIVGHATLTVLAGIALTPLLAYLLVANVFIYLNLRYEFFHSAR
jgi:hypothetical protein